MQISDRVHIILAKLAVYYHIIAHLPTPPNTNDCEQIEVVKVQVKREPSLGLQLEEVARGGDGRGLVLVAGVEPGGNAEASGKVRLEVLRLPRSSNAMEHGTFVDRFCLCDLKPLAKTPKLESERKLYRSTAHVHWRWTTTTASRRGEIYERPEVLLQVLQL